jgi:hypothetical protein
MDMSFDDFFIAIIAGGVALSAAYVRSEYRSWRAQLNADQRRDMLLADLHAARLVQAQHDKLQPDVQQMQIFHETEAVLEDFGSEVLERRSPVRPGAKRNQVFEERRGREKHHAAN